MGDFDLIISKEDFSPSISYKFLPAHEWKPPRISFELLLSGKSSFIYVPERVDQTPSFAEKHAKILTSLKNLLTKRGIADVHKWYDLLVNANAASAKLYVIDTNSERWEVIDVIFDYGQETGQLIVRHLGPRSREGEILIDIHRAYSFMLPMVVYSPLRYNPEKTILDIYNQVVKEYKKDDYHWARERAINLCLVTTGLRPGAIWWRGDRLENPEKALKILDRLAIPEIKYIVTTVEYPPTPAILIYHKSNKLAEEAIQQPTFKENMFLDHDLIAKILGYPCIGEIKGRYHIKLMGIDKGKDVVTNSFIIFELLCNEKHLDEFQKIVKYFQEFTEKENIPLAIFGLNKDRKTKKISLISPY